MHSLKTKYLRILLVILFLTNTIYAQQNIKTENILNPKQQNIITISAFAAKGDLKKLKDALIAGLESGLTINQIKEILVHLYAYCGFPRSI